MTNQNDTQRREGGLPLPNDFGAGHHHKQAKAMIGIAIMMAMGLLFYELGGKAAGPHASTAAAPQSVASLRH